MSERTFGNEIGNTKMTESEDIVAVSVVKNGIASSPMEAGENGAAVSRLPKPLAIEVYSKVHNSTLSKDSLLDDLEDLFDEKYYPGERLLSSGKEFTVVSSEKRGGLTTYTMDDGSKIGHRDLRRKKGLSIEEIKQIAIEDADFTEEKVWKVKESLLKENPVRETKKFAAIFTKNSAKKPAPPPPSTSSDSEGEEKADVPSTSNENSDETPRRRTARASGTPANSKLAEKKRLKEEKEKKDKEKAERKEKEKAEKLKKKEEEKAKKAEEKEKKTKKNGTLDKFVKLETNGTSPKGAAPIFSPSKWGERRVAAGVKKLEDAWKKRDHESFQDACTWCEKNLSGLQQKSIENPIFQFAVQRMVDRSKDKIKMKGMKWAKKAEYKQEMAEARKETYRRFEPQIKSWFSDDILQDDLLLTSERLELDAIRMECDEEMLKCMEITQFFVAMRKILLWNDNISAKELRDDLHNGLIGFEKSTFKMIANLLETALGEKEHEKTAHCNARVSEFPITAHTITELVRAFFLGKTEMAFKKDSKRTGDTVEDVEEDVDSEEKKVETEDLEMKEEDKEEEKEEKKEKKEEDEDEESDDDDEEEKERLRILGLFSDNLHIYEWDSEKQLDILYAMKEVVHNLPIIKEWFLKDANTDQMTVLKKKANDIGKEIEKFTQMLADVPPGEITDDMTRQQAREAERIQRKRLNLEKKLDDLKDVLEENREEMARERDDLERIYRSVSVGTDRHLRKYYWFAYSSDAGIWVQDFGTTALEYEKFVAECVEKGLTDVEDPSTPDMPEYTDLPHATNSTEVWYKLDTESSIRKLIASLKKKGRREKPLKKYLENNLDDIIASIQSAAPCAPAPAKATSPDSRENSPEEETGEEDLKITSEEAPEAVEPSQNSAEPQKFTGPLGSLKSTMSELLRDWQQSGISKIADIQLFETRMDDAKTLEEMKPMVIELVNSIPKEVLIEKFPQNIAIAKKCFSHLKMYRFVRRVQEATNSSCLHMLLAYFDARIDSQRTLPQLPCSVCRKKSNTNRKLMCKQCTTVYHNWCHKPSISVEQFDEEGFKEGWWCAKCVKEDRRRKLAEKKEENEEENGGSGVSSEEEDEEMEEELQENPRGRSAKRKANMAMRDVLELEGVLRREQLPPPPKRNRREPMPEIRKMFESIEKTNPRLYKVIQSVPPASRSLRNTQKDSRSLFDIEEDLADYRSVDVLREHLAQFFQHARGYVETHHPRKLDELDSLISELDLIM